MDTELNDTLKKEKAICPECGQEVLSYATVCQQCGCKIVVCPDCNTVFRAGTMRCSACGCILSEEIDCTFSKEDAAKIEARLDADQRRGRIIDSLSSTCSTLFAICFVISILIWFLWDAKDDLERLINMDWYMNLVRALLSIAFISIAIWTVLEGLGGDFPRIMSLCNWLDETKVNYKEYIRVRAGVWAAEKNLSYRFVQIALFYESKKEKSLLYFCVAFRLIVGIALIASGIVFACNTGTLLFVLRILQNEDWSRLIPSACSAGIFLVIALLWSLLFESLIFSKKVKRKEQEILDSKN